MCGLGIALLINLRGFGQQWDAGMNRNSAYVNKVLHLPWSTNPASGPTFRPAVAVFAIVVGLVTVIGVVLGGMR